MPTRNHDITGRPEVEDESTGTGSERHGRHREGDEALPGRGSTRGGLGRYAGRDEGSADDATSSRGTKQSSPDRPGPA
jgi:hypothetical protein